jgi:hypothetical protein
MHSTTCGGVHDLFPQTPKVVTYALMSSHLALEGLGPSLDTCPIT